MNSPIVPGCKPGVTTKKTRLQVLKERYQAAMGPGEIPSKGTEGSAAGPEAYGKPCRLGKRASSR